MAKDKSADTRRRKPWRGFHPEDAADRWTGFHPDPKNSSPDDDERWPLLRAPCPTKPQVPLAGPDKVSVAEQKTPKKRGRPRSPSYGTGSRAIFKETIDAICEVCDLSVKEIAPEAGISLSTFHRVLNDDRPKYDEKANTIARACIKLGKLNVDVITLQRHAFSLEQIRRLREK